MYTIGGMIMTIAGLSTNISTSGITNDIQIAMLKKNLDTVETAGADITKMMEASVTPELMHVFRNTKPMYTVFYVHGLCIFLKSS